MLREHLEDLRLNIKIYCSRQVCAARTDRNHSLSSLRSQKNDQKNCLGICEDSKVDAYYVLKPENVMLGFIRSKMIWSRSFSRWEIYDLVDDSLSMQIIIIFCIFDSDRSPRGENLGYVSVCVSMYLLNLAS